MLDMKDRHFPPDPRWLELWNRLDSDKRNRIAAEMGITRNLLRGYANGTKRMGPPRARVAAEVLKKLGYGRVNKGWFRPDLWNS